MPSVSHHYLILHGDTRIHISRKWVKSKSFLMHKWIPYHILQSFHALAVFLAIEFHYQYIGVKKYQFSVGNGITGKPKFKGIKSHESRKGMQEKCCTCTHHRISQDHFQVHTLYIWFRWRQTTKTKKIMYAVNDLNLQESQQRHRSAEEPWCFWCTPHYPAEIGGSILTSPVNKKNKHQILTDHILMTGSWW